MKLTYVSLNIWSGGRLFNQVIDFLREQNADIMALQEVWHGGDPARWQQAASFEEIGRILEYPHKAFEKSFPLYKEGQAFDSGNAVYSKYSITESSYTYFQGSYDAKYQHGGPDFSSIPMGVQNCIVELPGKTIQVLNLHGIWGFNGDDNPQRLKMGNIIQKQIRGDLPLIMSGDFNMSEDTESINTASKGLTSVFAGERTTSFNVKHKAPGTGYGTAVVDHLFVSDDFTILEHSSPDVDISDHLPLVATLQI